MGSGGGGFKQMKRRRRFTENTACTQLILPIQEHALTHSAMHVLIFRRILVEKGVLQVTGPRMLCSVYEKGHLQTVGRFLAHDYTKNINSPHYVDDDVLSDHAVFEWLTTHVTV
jgi:hypothetical protein